MSNQTNTSLKRPMLNQQKGSRKAKSPPHSGRNYGRKNNSNNNYPLALPLIPSLPILHAPKPIKHKRKPQQPPPKSATFENLPNFILQAMDEGKQSFQEAIRSYNLPSTSNNYSSNIPSIVSATGYSSGAISSVADDIYVVPKYKYFHGKTFTDEEKDDLYNVVKGLISAGLKSGTFFWNRAAQKMKSTRTGSAYSTRFAALASGTAKGKYRNSEFYDLKVQLDGLKVKDSCSSKIGVLTKITMNHQKRKDKLEKKKQEKEDAEKKEREQINKLTEIVLDKVNKENMEKKFISDVRDELNKFEKDIIDGKIICSINKNELMELRTFTYTQPNVVVSEFERIKKYFSNMDDDELWNKILEVLRLL